MRALPSEEKLATRRGFEPPDASESCEAPAGIESVESTQGIRSVVRSPNDLGPDTEAPAPQKRAYNSKYMQDGVRAVCIIEGCERLVSSRQMCKPHYSQWWYKPQRSPLRPRCLVELCDRPGRSDNGYCAMHHRRYLKSGDPLIVGKPGPVRLPRELPQGVGPAELGRMLGVSRQRAAQLLAPTKHAARTEVAAAVEQGIITKPPFCFRCGEQTEDIEAHHWDYARPLDVGWFCVPCHNVVHPHPGYNRKQAVTA